MSTPIEDRREARHLVRNAEQREKLIRMPEAASLAEEFIFCQYEPPTWPSAVHLAMTRAEDQSGLSYNATLRIVRAFFGLSEVPR